MGRRNRTRRGPLPLPEVRPDDPSLTRFAGMIPLIAFLTERLGLPAHLKAAIGADPARRRVHGVHLVLFAFVVGALGGVQRLAHLEWMKDDIVLLKYLRLGSWPVRKVFSAALASVSDAGVKGLELLVGAIGLSSLVGSKSIVVDIDNTAIVSHGTAEDAMFGYCGKGRRRRRHYPIVASVAENRAVVMAQYRDGSEMTAADHVNFFGAVANRVTNVLGSECRITFRGDSGFWSAAVARWMDESGFKFTFVLPMYAGLKLRLAETAFEAMTDDEDIEFARLSSEGLGIGHAGLVVAVIRRRVHDQSAPPQGKTIDWSPGWRYQAIITNNDWSAADIWRFYNYRAECERVFRIGKQCLGLANLVGHAFRANEVAFLLRLLAYNADIAFQEDCASRARRRDMPVARVGLEWRQIRFYLSPGRFLREHSRWILRTPVNIKLAELWAFYGPNAVAPAVATG
jgi:hypothetical protein